MKKKLCGFVAMAGILMMLAACGNDVALPVAINEETDTCEVCNMAVMDDQHATQIILENGKSMLFDDVGCMYGWMHDHENEKMNAQYVRDYNDKEWILIDDATYVYNQSIKTPMAYNVVSFKDKASAEKFAAENDGSALMTADELAVHSWEQNKEAMNKHGIENHSHSEETEAGSHSSGSH